MCAFWMVLCFFQTGCRHHKSDSFDFIRTITHPRFWCLSSFHIILQLLRNNSTGRGWTFITGCTACRRQVTQADLGGFATVHPLVQADGSKGQGPGTLTEHGKGLIADAPLPRTDEQNTHMHFWKHFVHLLSCIFVCSVVCICKMAFYRFCP